MPHLRFRLPRRRGAGPGGVRAEPALRPVGSAVSGRPRRPGLGGRHRDQALYLNSDDPYKRGLPGTELTFAYSYGDPAARGGQRQGARPGHRQVAGQRWRAGEQPRRPSGRAVSACARAAVHYHQMRGTVTGTKPGDSVQVVRGRRRDERVLHLPSRVRRQPRRGRRRRGLHRRLAGPAAWPELPRLLPERLGGQRDPPTSTTSTPADARPRLAWRPSHYDAAAGTPATTSSPAPPAAAPATRTGWRSTSCSSSVPTSTRVAGWPTRATSPAPSTPASSVNSSTTPRARSPATRRPQGG